VEAYKGNIAMPNRHVEPLGNTYEGHLLESETYVGGHVEALEAGVFRSDIATDFKLDASRLQQVSGPEFCLRTAHPDAARQLIDDLDDALKFSIREEGKMRLEDVTNYDEVRDKIQGMLEALRDTPNVQVEPLIYHLDVAAMYPNIMLSNRLQPDSVVDEAMCATCDYNRPGMTCNKEMEWSWRGDFYPAKRDEVNMIRHALSSELFPARFPNGPKRTYHELSATEQSALLKKRLGDYSRKVYKKTHETKTVERKSIICQRENPFYIDTVRAFRDRRYEYKGLHKTWKKNLETSEDDVAVAEARKMIVLYDSMQLAHKCILNSFYGYVMRKGARWYSMEMAGITCLTGSKIIQLARELVERIGRPLELDTDGIWCMLPGTFPENFTFKTKTGKGLGISYPCTMLNHLTHQRFTNHQYHTLTDPTTGHYEVHSENSIFFELDGPYRAMILPSSKEEDKLLKKRYAVFEHDGTLAELKGFEVKRRGELQLIKDFQTQIFKHFLQGKTLQACYNAVGAVANQWLDILFSKGGALHDDELIDLIAENKSMSKTLAEYGTQKSTAITTAKRLAEFLGAQMVKDRGLACKFIVSAKPHGAPVTERAVPVALFNAEPSVKQYYLRRFLRDPALTNFDLRSLLDWDYYVERFGGVIQKLITIPAAMQHIANPVPRIRHPDWLFRRVAASDDKFKQRKLTDLFKVQHKRNVATAAKIAEASADGSTTATAPTEPAAEPKSMGPPAPKKVAEFVFEVFPEEDYSAWLAMVRPRWLKERKERAKQAAIEGRTARTRGSAFGAMDALVSRTSRSMASATWDVLQITPTARPGEFRLWVSIDQQMHNLRLRVPRQFYVNFKRVPAPGTFADSYVVESLTRTLPRGTPCRHLFRITVDESVYLEEEVHFSALLNHANVDGVYEMQVPLEVRAHLQLGSACSMHPRSQHKLSRGIDAGFELADLVKAKPMSMHSRRYLDGGRGQRYFYLYHATKDTRHVFGLITPEGQARIHVADTAGLRQMPNLETLYVDVLANAREKHGDMSGGAFELPSALEADLKVHTSAERAFKALSKDMTTLRTAKQGGAVLVLKSARPLAYYERNMGTAIAEFPVLHIPTPDQDDRLPALGWQRSSATRMFNQYLHAAGEIIQVVGLASQFDLPFCNIGSDTSVAGADIDFARRLVQHDMVLWWSAAPQPDLGGREEDCHSAQTAGKEDGLLETSKPGCYSSVVFEVQLGDLAIDAVLQSGSINDMEGSGGGSLAFDTASHNLDEYAKGTVHSSTALGDSVLTSQVFNTVKAMLKAWSVERARATSPESSLLSENFWRWVSSPTSALYEPALQSFLQSLMRKTLLQLLAEFKRLGASIVYASFGRLFLLTSKPTAGSAAAYGRYLMTAVTSRDLFKHIKLEIVHFWEYLLWMDVANFGGVISSDPQAVELSRQGAVESNWNISTFLPQAVEPRFKLIVSTFIQQLYLSKCENAAALERTPMRAIQQVTPGGTEAAPGTTDGTIGLLVDPIKTAQAHFAKQLLSKRMTRQLLRAVDDIKKEHTEEQDALRQQRYDEEDAEAVKQRWQFPDLPGRVVHPSTRTSPALEFVKTIMAVLGLARELSEEVGVLRRNLLELLQVREFAPESEWRNPCEAFKLPHVICAYCNEERTMDLARDGDLMPERPGKARAWECNQCHALYDRPALEHRLCGMANALVTTFALQDLRCNKCGGVRANNIAPHCNCSGSWGLTVTRKDTLRRLTAMRHLARFHALHVVEAAVASLIALV
jgi:DNA polymerase epsilon subunit 1